MKIGFWIYSFILISSLAVAPSRMNLSKTNTLFINAISLTSEYFPADKNKQLVYESDFGESVLEVKKEADFNIFTFKGDDFTYRKNS